MNPQRTRIIREECGLGDDLLSYFDVVGAMLFHIDEFPECLQHPKRDRAVVS